MLKQEAYVKAGQMLRFQGSAVSGPEVEITQSSRKQQAFKCQSILSRFKLGGNDSKSDREKEFLLWRRVNVLRLFESPGMRQKHNKNK